MPKAFLLKRRSQNGPHHFKELKMKETTTGEATDKSTSFEQEKEVFSEAPKMVSESQLPHYHHLSAFTKYQSDLEHQQRLLHSHIREMQMFYPYGYRSKVAFFDSALPDDSRKFMPFPIFHRPQDVLFQSLEKQKLFKAEDAKLRLAENDRRDAVDALQGSDVNQPLKCEQCGKTFKTKYTLAIHLKMPSHTGARPFVCGICGKGFRLSSTLCRHKIIHTTDRPHKCHICDKAFNRSSTLKTHVRTHSEVKEYICEVCDKGFHQKGNLRNHTLIHTGEKPYKCRLCEKAFNKLSNLKFHMHVHTDNSPYRCRYCKVSFTRRCDLKSHIANVHEKNQSTIESTK